MLLGEVKREAPVRTEPHPTGAGTSRIELPRFPNKELNFHIAHLLFCDADGRGYRGRLERIV
jgi:hypothetical protein